MITVLYLCDYPKIGGSSLSLINALESLGNRIKPIIAVSQEGEVSEYCKLNNIQCIIAPFYYDYYRYKGDWYHHLRKKLSYAKHMYKTNNDFVKTVVSALDNTHVDIVHSNTSAVSFGSAIAKKLHAKHIWQVREFLDEFTDAHIWGGKNYLIRKLKKSDAVITSTHILATHFNIDNIPTTYSLWDAVKHKDDTCFDTDKEKYILFCSKGVSKFKGIDYLVDAFGQSELPKLGYVLFIIGECSNILKEELLSLAKKYNIEKNLHFHGLAFDTELKTIYSKATAFVQCSKIEGLGRVVIEAMFYGCPVIARNNGGSAEIIKHKKTGFLFDTKQELIEEMEAVANEQPLTVTKNAQDFAKESFAIEDYGDKLHNIYDKVLNVK